MRPRRRRDRGDSKRADATLTNRSLAALFSPPPEPTRPLRVTTPVRLVEDRRTYHPLGQKRPARALTSSATRLTPSSKKFRAQLPFGLRFAVPDQVAICVRRKKRKEVLHALAKTGRGKRRRRLRKNWFSRVSC